MNEAAIGLVIGFITFAGLAGAACMMYVGGKVIEEFLAFLFNNWRP